MNTILQSIFSAQFIFTILRVSTPIILATMAAVITSRAGITNIGIEGVMLNSSLVSVLVSAYTQNIWLGLLAGIITGIVSSLLIGYVVLDLKADLTLTCIAFNIMAAGGTIYFMYALTRDKGNTISLDSGVLPSIRLPIIDKIPFLGQILSNHNILSYVALISVLIVWLMLYKTALGLRIRTAGEAPEALESVGVSVKKIRYYAFAMSGFLAGLAGVFMSMGYVTWFSRNNAGGRGFIALAADAMGQSKPLASALSALLFGVAEALSYPLQATTIPSEIVQMLPYVVTIFGLVMYAVNENRKKNKIKTK